MIVFAGPSIAGIDPALTDGFDLRPPAQQGDVFLAALDQPLVIGIIDGYFEGVPSVWHKEILWALSRGIAVCGASSMGALRAAELDSFGMRGTGEIYAAYRDGVLEDDDEVALLHGPAELGYPGLSLAMVNVRATVDAARTDGIVTSRQAGLLKDVAKSQFYKSRTWHSILAEINIQDLPKDANTALRSWLGENEVDQKKLDAADLLTQLSDGAFSSSSVDFHFEETDLWITATHTWRRRRHTEPETERAGYSLLGGL
ncbi:tfuA protein [Roseobacter sp. YSTF-M11]|uniref:TfuA protein n=1 Tax=Roseobacter insulae TaxID=2859783 RepID=A0A9X1FT97_9RHOB|nr:TfuA-like protein [Roseobacter insulae]MBW4707379.1 tfuA protein [Roseobacter insulae]